MADAPICRLCDRPVALAWNPTRAVACDNAGRWVHVDCRARQRAESQEVA